MWLIAINKISIFEWATITHTHKHTLCTSHFDVFMYLVFVVQLSCYRSIIINVYSCDLAYFEKDSSKLNTLSTNWMVRICIRTQLEIHSPLWSPFPSNSQLKSAVVLLSYRIGFNMPKKSLPSLITSSNHFVFFVSLLFLFCAQNALCGVYMVPSGMMCIIHHENCVVCGIFCESKCECSFVPFVWLEATQAQFILLAIFRLTFKGKISTWSDSTLMTLVWVSWNFIFDHWSKFNRMFRSFGNFPNWKTFTLIVRRTYNIHKSVNLRWIWCYCCECNWSKSFSEY